MENNSMKSIKNKYLGTIKIIVEKVSRVKSENKLSV